MDQPAPKPEGVPGMPSRNVFDEEAYLSLHPDVSEAFSKGIVGSAWQHFELHGFAEGRKWVPRADRLIDVRREIAAGDEMYVGDDNEYFDTGESAVRCIEAALFSARIRESAIKKILDLPCGHGRVMRFLRKAFPRAELTACDLNREGVEFCADNFGAKPVVSQTDPERIPLREKFDLIWCGSLLTHLPQEACAAFLQLFQRLLQPNGVLIFTTHGRGCERELVTGRTRFGLDDRQIAELMRDYRQRGFGYVDYSSQKGYGICLSHPSFVISHFIDQPEWQLLGYHESGWDRRQDVVCIRRVGEEATAVHDQTASPA